MEEAAFKTVEEMWEVVDHEVPTVSQNLLEYEYISPNLLGLLRDEAPTRSSARGSARGARTGVVTRSRSKDMPRR